MDLINESIRELEDILLERDISQEEWNIYSKAKDLSNSSCLMEYFNVLLWDDIKNKANKKVLIDLFKQGKSQNVIFKNTCFVSL